MKRIKSKRLMIGLIAVGLGLMSQNISRGAIPPASVNPTQPVVQPAAPAPPVRPSYTAPAVPVESMGLRMIQVGNVRRVIYVVQTGDCLWNISKRFLNSPYYWPKIWERNSFILNPHLIYPGDILNIFPEVISTVPLGPVTVGPTETTGPGVSYIPMGTTGFISLEELAAAGEIVDNLYHKMLLGENDRVYVDVGKVERVVPGDLFSIFRVQVDERTGKYREVRHPVTGELIGYKIINLGTMKLTGIEAKVSEGMIIDSFQEIQNHDRIISYWQPLAESVAVVETQVELVKGYIIASKNDVLFLGQHDVVYIDLGSDAQVVRGNVFVIYKPCQYVPDGLHDDPVLIPPKILGHLVVLDAKKKTSVALITDAAQEIQVGERIFMSRYNQWEIEGVSQPGDLERCRVNPRCRLITRAEYDAGMESPYCERPKTEEPKPERKPLFHR